MQVHEFSSYVDQMPGLSVVKDIHSKIIACSPLFVQMLGYKSATQIKGKTDLEVDCLDHYAAEQFIMQDTRALNSGQNSAIDICTYNDGDKRIIFSQKTRLIHANKVCGINAIGFDLIPFNTLAHKIFSLVEKDGRFLKIKSKKIKSYKLAAVYSEFNLTKQESICLFYIMRGKSNKEIAILLNLSLRTIEGKIITIKEKLNCTSRNQIIEKALDCDLLTVIIQKLLSNNNCSLMVEI